MRAPQFVTANFTALPVLSGNYTGCSSASRLTVTFTFSANAGGVTGSKTLYSQTR